MAFIQKVTIYDDIIKVYRKNIFLIDFPCLVENHEKNMSPQIHICMQQRLRLRWGR